MLIPYYTNKKGKQVTLYVTRHAQTRFLQRMRQLERNGLIENGTVNCHAVEAIAKIFIGLKPDQNINATTKKRRKKHGTDTLYFKSKWFTFIVQNATIVTIEIRGEHRNLNKNRIGYIKKY